MTAVRRLSQLLGALAIGTVGVLLVLEATEVTDGQWRVELADGIAKSTFPSWALWASGLMGAALAVIGISIVAAQVAPERKGLNTLHHVHKSHDGDTAIRGRAAVSAVKHELEAVEGVVAVDARVVRKTMHVELLVDDRANLTELENEARRRLGHEFWIDLGLADFAVNLLVTHHPNPPRVR